jgi:hypothetical protein
MDILGDEPSAAQAIARATQARTAEAAPYASWAMQAIEEWHTFIAASNAAWS